MIKKYSLTSIVNLEGSLLRKDFESFDGEFVDREIDLHKVTDKIVDLEARPEFSPVIGIFQLRKLSPNLFYIFDERVYTSNEFLDGFEKFLRANLISVRANNFEDVPKEYKHFFNTPYTGVPVDMVRTQVAVSYPNGNYKAVAHDKFKGADFNSSCTLKMLEPKILSDKLEQMEMAGNFSVIIKKSEADKDSEIISFEYRKGNEYKTVEHLIFKS